LGHKKTAKRNKRLLVKIQRNLNRI